MLYEEAVKVLTPDEINEAEGNGKLWGELEASNWEDRQESRGGTHFPEWTLGGYCGDLSHIREEVREEFELVLDLSARDAWDASVELITAWNKIETLCEESPAVESYEIDKSEITIDFVNGETITFTDPGEAITAIESRDSE